MLSLKIKKANSILIRAVVLGLVAGIVFTGQVYGEKKDKDKEGDTSTATDTAPVIASRSITGEIGTIREGEYITVIYNQGKAADGKTVKDYEIVLPIDEAIALSHVRDISQLNEGDTIEIVYDETSWIDKNGVSRIKHKAKEIRFKKSAVKALRSK